jgi:hypothetical protein
MSDRTAAISPDAATAPGKRTEVATDRAHGWLQLMCVSALIGVNRPSGSAGAFVPASGAELDARHLVAPGLRLGGEGDQQRAGGRRSSERDAHVREGVTRRKRQPMERDSDRRRAGRQTGPRT